MQVQYSDLTFGILEYVLLLIMYKPWIHYCYIFV